MSIDFIDLTSTSKFLGQVDRYEIIRFESDRIEDDYYVVFNKEKHPTEPYLVMELWQFEGGYDHRFHRFLEQDAGLNITVPVFTPTKHQVQIQKILNYRTASGLTDKEEFFFNMVADQVQEQADEEYCYPYELLVEIKGREKRIIATQWTPLQKIPVEKLCIGATIEIWEVEKIFTMMRLLNL